MEESRRKGRVGWILKSRKLAENKKKEQNKGRIMKGNGSYEISNV